MKPGIRTTEFWATLATQAIAVVAIVHPGFRLAASDTLVPAFATVAAAAASGVYAIGRTIAKRNAAAPANPYKAA